MKVLLFMDYGPDYPTEEMNKISNHWVTLNRKFDAIYTGFLGSIEQVSVVCDITNAFKENNIIILLTDGENTAATALLNLDLNTPEFPKLYFFIYIPLTF